MNQLIIGIGGAGTHVINKLIKTREAQNNQRVEYIAIDCDFESEIYSLNLSHVALHVGLNSGHAKIGMKEFKNLWTGPPITLDEYTLTRGTGQIRPIGRFAIFMHAVKIRERITEKINSINAYDIHNFGRTNSLQIDICFSIAGGMGSGGFLDVMNIVQDVCRATNTEASIRGNIFMPHLYDQMIACSNSKIRIFGNAYAALRELYFLAKGGTIELYTGERTGSGPTFKLETTMATGLYGSIRVFNIWSNEIRHWQNNYIIHPTYQLRPSNEEENSIFSLCADMITNRLYIGCPGPCCANQTPSIWKIDTKMKEEYQKNTSIFSYHIDKEIKTKMDAIQLEVPMVCEDGFKPYMPHLL